MLTRFEKFAVFNLSLVVFTVLLFIILSCVAGLSRAQGALGLIGLIGLGHFIFLRRRRSSEVVEDERDTAIKAKAASYGYSTSLAFFIISSLAIYYRYGAEGVVSVDLFPLLAWSGWAVYIVASSVITLIYYNRGIPCGTF